MAFVLRNSLFTILILAFLGLFFNINAHESLPILDSIQWEAALENYQYNPFQERPEVAPPENRQWDLGALQTFFIIFSILLLVVLIGIFLYYYRFKQSKTIVEEETTAYFKSIEENLDKTDLEPEINKAISAGKYDIALRLLYLNTLKLLDAQYLISFSPNKPNGAYVSTIRKLFPHNSTFSELTIWFERVWYGKQSIDKSLFEKLHTRFLNYKEFILQNSNDER